MPPKTTTTLTSRSWLSNLIRRCRERLPPGVVDAAWTILMSWRSVSSTYTLRWLKALGLRSKRSNSLSFSDWLKMAYTRELTLSLPSTMKLSPTTAWASITLATSAPTSLTRVLKSNQFLLAPSSLLSVAKSTQARQERSTTCKASTRLCASYFLDRLLMNFRLPTSA